MKHKIGILHPGQMGEFIASTLKKGASRQGLIDAETLEKLCCICDLIVSVCPPVFAENVAQQVLDNPFQGIYIDANAINPQRSIRIGERMESAGISYIDGGIIGNPAWDTGATSLYLSGKEVTRILDSFPDSNLEVHSLGEEIGKASAVKMCYASYTKGTTALLCGILALAEKNGVRDALEYEWSRDRSTLAENAKQRASRVTAKAWRFTGEMEEIAQTFADASLPEGFHKASAEIFRRLEHFKDAPNYPSVEEVLAALNEQD